MKYPQDLINLILFPEASPGNSKDVKSCFLAEVIDSTYAATTERVAREILLNSSKQPQSPL